VPPYLKLSFLKGAEQSGSTRDGVNQENEEEEEEDGNIALQEDPAVLLPSTEETQAIMWEVHIVYSNIWQTPVLYVIASQPGGRPFPWDMMERLLSPRFKGGEGHDDGVIALER